MRIESGTLLTVLLAVSLTLLSRVKPIGPATSATCPCSTSPATEAATGAHRGMLGIIMVRMVNGRLLTIVEQAKTFE